MCVRVSECVRTLGQRESMRRPLGLSAVSQSLGRSPALFAFALEEEKAEEDEVGGWGGGWMEKRRGSRKRTEEKSERWNRGERSSDAARRLAAGVRTLTAPALEVSKVVFAGIRCLNS